MSPNTKKLLEEALRLEPAERASLAGQLIDSIDEVAEADVEQGWRGEIERRCQEIDSGDVDLVPWEEVRKRLFGRDGAAG
jgi:putative addiction module component (TIGR02574 family)